MYSLFSIYTFSDNFGKVSGSVTRRTSDPAPPHEVEGTTVTRPVDTFRWSVDLAISFLIDITSQADDCLAAFRARSSGTEKQTYLS